jgi:hypothetical protein
MQLDEFFNYKNKLMEDILTNEKIVRLLCNKGEAPNDAMSFAYTKVFPYENVPDTVEYADTFVCFDVDIQKSMNQTYLLPVIYVWVFSHKSLLRLPEGGVRTDKLSSELAEVLNGSRAYGLGNLELYSVKRFAPMTDYQGKVLTFHAKDFSRLSPNANPVPTNRKTG